MHANNSVLLAIFIALLIYPCNTGMAVDRYFVFQGGTVLFQIQPLALHRNLLIYSNKDGTIDSVAVDSLKELNEYGGTKSIHGAVVGGAIGVVFSWIATSQMRAEGSGENIPIVPFLVVVGAGVGGALAGSAIVKGNRTKLLNDLQGKSTEEKTTLLRKILFE